MSGLEILLGVAGALATLLVVVGMILITPRGEVDVAGNSRESQGEELSRSDTPAPAASRR